MTPNEEVKIMQDYREQKTGVPTEYDKNYPRSPANIPLSNVLSRLTKAQRERLVTGFDINSFARLFEDGDLMATVDSFLANGMNISETARKLYMHRNTLMYRLNKIRDQTGLDLRSFDMAVTFEILRGLYEIK